MSHDLMQTAVKLSQHPENCKWHQRKKGATTFMGVA
jgi:hypothetical protein